MSTFQLIGQVSHDDSQANGFLQKVYREEKSQFLIDHNLWWYRGDQHRFVVVTADGEVVGHSAIVPTTCLIDGEAQESWWWVDLIVDPAFRGRGIQTMLDQAVRDSAELKFAFPARDLSGKMFKRHGWQMREDVYQLTFIFSLLALPRVRLAQGVKGQLLRTAVQITSPVARLIRAYLTRYTPINARSLEDPDPETLAQVFFDHNRRDDRITTWRDAHYLRWRFLEAPYYAQLKFYVAGPSDNPSQVLITRTLDYRGVKTVRLLDIFGDLRDQAGLRDILRLAMRDAARQNAGQIVAISSVPLLTKTLRSLGFFMRRPLQFCWHNKNETAMQRFGESLCHWTYADSDTDQ